MYRTVWNQPGAVNTLRLRPNGPHFGDKIYKFVSLYEHFCILIQISLKFVPTGSINKKPTLVSGNGLVLTRGPIEYKYVILPV